MTSGRIFAYDPRDIPEWMRNHRDWPVATEVTRLKKLVVQVEMCCNICVEKVDDVVSGMPGVASYEIERYNSLLTIVETPSGGPNHKKLVKKLKNATHDRKATILRQTETETPTCTSASTVVYTWIPYMGPGYLVPWPAPSSSSQCITNPNYLQHPTACGHCLRYADVMCANCGRGSDYGARSP